ncbi:MAG TPA: VOC family protein [Williamwhitmania sp.]|nr:VOC family protein [Williamwhitmania sp.]
MIRLVITISIATALTSCNSPNKITKNMEERKNETTNTPSTNDTTPKVTGIGGIFFFSDNPKETREWYAKNLGFEINEWGSSSFESRNVSKPDEINSLQWSPFKKGDAYFAPSKKDFMINYRVQNIEGLVSKLKANGVTILDSIATYDYGKFVHIMDAEGNKIELWEPAEADKKGGETIK